LAFTVSHCGITDILEATIKFPCDVSETSLMEFTAVRLGPGVTQPPIHWLAGALSPGVKWTGREADHSPPPNTKVKNAWNYTSTLPYVIMARCLVKHKMSPWHDA
jgi:hypothetical protein